LKADVIRLLEALRVSQAQPLIAADIVRPGAERLLVEALERYQAGVPVFAADENGNVALWHWDDSTAKLSSTVLPADEVELAWAARLADKLLALKPDNRAYQRQALVLAFESAGDLRGAGNGSGERSSPAIERLTSTADASLLSAVLSDAMKGNRPQAAATAAELLGQRGDASVLYSRGPQPAPLADALVYPDRRVRFAALAAIMALDPSSPFPGASRVPEALGYFATGANGRQAVVAMPAADQTTTLTGMLNHIGIEADPATRGGSAVQLARQSADLELLLVDVDVQSPGIRDVLYALRSDPATGRIPIGLMATGERLETARQLAAEHQRVVAFSRPQTDQALAAIVEQLSQISGRHRLSPAQRAAMAGQAVAWLGDLLARESTFYDLRREAPVLESALYQSELASQSTAALALVGTPSSQRALVDYASRTSLPIDARGQAADAFRASVGRHGILLSEVEILRQYDRYNASATADAATQQVLGSLLDTIESLRAAADATRH
jgi:CheY-like chemotaxis protein